MATEVDICNQALSFIRGGFINSLTEASTQARYCKSFFDDVRDTVLRDGSWNFATKIEPLALRTDDVYNWVYCYQYPSDCMKVQRLILNYEQFSADSGVYRTRQYQDLGRPDIDRFIKHKVMNVNGEMVIVANEPDLRIQYTSKVTNMGLFPVDVRKAMAHLLASELAVPITGAQLGRAMKSDELTLYQNYLSAANSNDGNDNYQEPPESDFILARI